MEFHLDYPQMHYSTLAGEERSAIPQQLLLFLSENFIISSDIHDISEKPESTPEEIIDALSFNPTLREAFDSFSGTNEEFRISEHSCMVIQTEAEFRLYDRIASICPATHSEFRLFLALHDIGKGFAVREYPRGRQRKKAELLFNRVIIAKALPALNLKPESLSLFLAMQQLDTLGEYLKGVIDQYAAAEQLMLMAKSAAVAPSKFLRIFETYFLADAGSYPYLRKKIFKEHHGALVHNQENQQKMDALYTLITSFESLPAYQ